MLVNSIELTREKGDLCFDFTELCSFLTPRNRNEHDFDIYVSNTVPENAGIIDLPFNYVSKVSVLYTYEFESDTKKQYNKSKKEPRKIRVDELQNSFGIKKNGFLKPRSPSVIEASSFTNSHIQRSYSCLTGREVDVSQKVSEDERAKPEPLPLNKYVKSSNTAENLKVDLFQINLRNSAKESRENLITKKTNNVFFLEKKRNRDDRSSLGCSNSLFNEKCHNKSALFRVKEGKSVHPNPATKSTTFGILKDKVSSKAQATSKFPIVKSSENEPACNKDIDHLSFFKTNYSQEEEFTKHPANNTTNIEKINDQLIVPIAIPTVTSSKILLNQQVQPQGSKLVIDQPSIAVQRGKKTCFMKKVAKLEARVDEYLMPKSASSSPRSNDSKKSEENVDTGWGYKVTKDFFRKNGDQTVKTETGNEYTKKLTHDIPGNINYLSESSSVKNSTSKIDLSYLNTISDDEEEIEYIEENIFGKEIITNNISHQNSSCVSSCFNCGTTFPSDVSFIEKNNHINSCIEKC